MRRARFARAPNGRLPRVPLFVSPAVRVEGAVVLMSIVTSVPGPVARAGLSRRLGSAYTGAQLSLVRCHLVARGFQILRARGERAQRSEPRRAPGLVRSVLLAKLQLGVTRQSVHRTGSWRRQASRASTGITIASSLLPIVLPSLEAERVIGVNGRQDVRGRASRPTPSPPGRSAAAWL